MPASTTMDMPQQREENKRAYIYIYVLQQRCHYMKIHSTFNHSPISKKKNSETSDTNQRSKIQRHYHTNTTNQPNTPNKNKKENQKGKMSLATFKALTSLTVLASIPIYGAYLVTADHSA